VAWRDRYASKVVRPRRDRYASKVVRPRRSLGAAARGKGSFVFVGAIPWMVLKALVLEVQVLRLRVPPLHLLFSFSLVLELVLWKALPRLI